MQAFNSKKFRSSKSKIACIDTSKINEDSPLDIKLERGAIGREFRWPKSGRGI